ncbi:amidophosphoribosyltransferase [Candidatus Parcubacteria bacterium]|nr:MAG: amidophosphoribosyltransferase [Candidatus Parcubacteria bacterium]
MLEDFGEPHTVVYDELRGEKCGVFGVFGQGLDAARLTYFGLYALQHRGQESSGIATSDSVKLHSHVGMGLVSQVFSEADIEKLPGSIAMGHNRYSTAGGSRIEHAQPIIVDGGAMGQIALAHNGNLPSATALVAFLGERGITVDGASDSRLMAEAIAAVMREGSSTELGASKTLAQAVGEVYPYMTGAFSLLVMSKDELVAVRDECGMRPLSIGKLNGGYIFSSETCAFSPIGAQFIGDVEPGEMVVVNAQGLQRQQLTTPNPKLDIFEFVYFSRPDSELLGKSVYNVRKNFGRELAVEVPIGADVIIPVPETSVPAAIGFSQARGIPFEMGLTKNRYIHRTFIQPEQHIREQGVKAKLTPQIEVIKGRRVAVLDDSIVRGTTSRQIVQMLFEAGAMEVHFLVSSPPVIFPDFYGIDTPKQEDLLAATRSIAEMRDYLGATSLHFLSYKGMIKATGLPEDRFSTSFFTGEYPIDIRERRAEISAKRICYTPFDETYDPVIEEPAATV